MLNTANITEFDAGLPATYAFRITGAVTRDDMAAMAERMLAVFDAHSKVDMLLVFETGTSSEPGASLSMDSMKAQVESLAKVRNYVVAQAPDRAGNMVETMGKLMPVEARAFDTEAEALDWLRAQPAPQG
ncbi:STAS/SEC14 domain-containing protein [Citreimonas salinaria]|uniref:SpoIIAA-like n=1 Tax=Citreimonas salinaria TaxID=321339 RepID=A0A1H3HZF3_9RHOB|nr:STAS/SEC14 domain-containing protein [Citreimonas salinaria]SDY20847.1 SpoIIAA-like [Citreimonas salinaria]